jgi:hypothetical protein
MAPVSEFRASGATSGSRRPAGSSRR